MTFSTIMQAENFPYTHKEPNIKIAQINEWTKLRC